MTKNVPVRVKDVILPFDWDVEKVWALEADSMTEMRSDFDYLLYYPLWSSEPGKGMLFDLSPMTVIDYPNASDYQKERLASTDTSYPIDILEYQDQIWLLDGSHRLAKLYMQNSEEVVVRRHDESILDSILVR